MSRRSCCLIKSRYYYCFLAFFYLLPFSFSKLVALRFGAFLCSPIWEGIVGVWDPFMTGHTWTGIVMWRAGVRRHQKVSDLLCREWAMERREGGESEGSASRRSVRRSFSKEGICYWDWNARSRLAAPSRKLDSIQCEPPLLSLSPRRVEFMPGMVSGINFASKPSTKNW